MSRKMLILFVAVMGVLAVNMGVLGDAGTAEMGSASRSFLPLVHNGPPPENIADARDLSTWVNEFVHAYGGKVTVNGIEMNASQLADEIRQNGDEYVVPKQTMHGETSFLIVKDIPLAMRDDVGKWQEVSLRFLGQLDNIVIGTDTGENFGDEKWQRTLVAQFDRATIDDGLYWDQSEPVSGSFAHFWSGLTQ